MNPTAITGIALIVIGVAILALTGQELASGVCLALGGTLALVAGVIGLVNKRRNDVVVTRAVLLILVGFWLAFTGLALMAS